MQSGTGGSKLPLALLPRFSRRNSTASPRFCLKTGGQSVHHDLNNMSDHGGEVFASGMTVHVVVVAAPGWHQLQCQPMFANLLQGLTGVSELYFRVFESRLVIFQDVDEAKLRGQAFRNNIWII